MRFATRSCCAAPLLFSMTLPVFAQTPLRLDAIATGLENPVWAGSPEGDARVFVIEQFAARIRIVRDGVVEPLLTYNSPRRFPELFQQDPHRGSGTDSQLPHEIFTADRKVPEGEGGALVQDCADAAPEGLQAAHPLQPVAAANLVGSP